MGNWKDNKRDGLGKYVIKHNKYEEEWEGLWKNDFKVE